MSKAVPAVGVCHVSVAAMKRMPNHLSTQRRLKIYYDGSSGQYGLACGVLPKIGKALQMATQIKCPR